MWWSLQYTRVGKMDIGIKYYIDDIFDFNDDDLDDKGIKMPSNIQVYATPHNCA